MPISSIMMLPGFGMQSQCWEISLAKFTYVTLFFLKVESTPYAADDSALQMFSLCVSVMAPFGHSCEHIGHRMHLGERFCAFSPMISGRFSGQACLHLPHPMHFVSSISKPTVLCCRILPFCDVQPMPRFLMAPPKPASSCPLQCETTIIASASAMAPETSISSRMPFVFMRR